MGKFITNEVPAWRIVLWGFVAAIAVFMLGYFLSGHVDFRLFILATLAGSLFSVFGFLLLWSARSGWATKNVKTLLVVLIVGQACLLLWSILDHRK
jgi:hypothetical protein